MSALDIKEIRAKHGRRCLLFVFTDEALDEKYEFAVRPPTTAEFDRFMSKAEDNRQVELQTLAAVCTVYPEEATVSSLMKDFPALYVGLAGEALKLAGASAGALKKI